MLRQTNSLEKENEKLRKSDGLTEKLLLSAGELPQAGAEGGDAASDKEGDL